MNVRATKSCRLHSQSERKSIVENIGVTHGSLFVRGRRQGGRPLVTKRAGGRPCYSNHRVPGSSPGGAHQAFQALKQNKVSVPTRSSSAILTNRQVCSFGAAFLRAGDELLVGALAGPLIRLSSTDRQRSCRLVKIVSESDQIWTRYWECQLTAGKLNH